MLFIARAMSVGTQAGLRRLTPHRVTLLTDVPIARATALTPDGGVWVGNTGGLTRFTAAGRRHYGEAGVAGVGGLATQVIGRACCGSPPSAASRASGRGPSGLAGLGHGHPRIFSLVHTGAALAA
jgi:hypothetical protein